ncbi:DAK2 domain-containing protein [Nocardioides cheoyonin]|uniref:DAK2 domain-containing protein n=1 Tax=Nocardioides cheoyonin TaxID=3156615 RepID=UPI0032B3485A
MTTLDLRLIHSFADLATDALAAHREEIDALNVYPVPDGDTGTNLYLTIAAARDRLREEAPTDPAEAIRVFAKGALLGARGNSGVILAEMVGALIRRYGEAGEDECHAAVLAAALRQATEASYAAVGEPQEGTMLTVLGAAADAAERAAADGRRRTREVVAAAAKAARESLAHTPEQLAVLAEAGVVDAGGRGISVLLDAYETAATGRRPVPGDASPGTHTIPVPVGHTELSPDGPAYEVMYLLDAEDGQIPALRKALAPLGDSLVVVGGEGIWNVHVHVDDVGAAIEAGIAAGRPHRIHVTHFAEQAAERAPVGRSGRRVVAVSAGPGLTSLFESAGAVVVEGGPRRRPSSSRLLSAMVDCGAAEIIVLPNDHDSVRAAEAAARTAEEDHGIKVAVVPTVAQVQGLAAVAVHEPGRTFDKDVLEMTATARHARHGAVTLATKRAITMAGPCLPGDALGVIDGDFVKVGHDLAEVASFILGRLIGGGGELVTIVSGQEDADGELAAAAAAWVEAHHPTVDAVVYDGGQERYPLLVSVE